MFGSSLVKAESFTEKKALKILGKKSSEFFKLTKPMNQLSEFDKLSEHPRQTF